MTDRDALLAAIREVPDEDTPRLVYADWLQENGQDKCAEFIRVQIELSRLSSNDSNILRHMKLRNRESELWGSVSGGGHISLAGLRGSGLHPPVKSEPFLPFGLVRRGFVETIYFPMREFTNLNVNQWAMHHPVMSLVAADRKPARALDFSVTVYHWNPGWTCEVSDDEAGRIPTSWYLEMHGPNSPLSRCHPNAWATEREAMESLNEHAMYIFLREKTAARMKLPPYDLCQ